jgi:hypothetical protein
LKNTGCKKKNGRFCDPSKKCLHCYDRSFASNHRLVSWSLEDKNPFQISKNSKNKISLNCYKCGHLFIISLTKCSIGDRKSLKIKQRDKNGKKVPHKWREMTQWWCQYCNGRRPKVCETQLLNHELNKKEFGDKYIPELIRLKCQNEQYWFNSPDCNHSFEISPYNILKGHWCSYCNGNKKCLEELDCEFCIKKNYERI